MKKWVSMILSVIITAGAGLGVSCSEVARAKAHTHEYVKKETVAPTCTEQGYTVYKCSCGVEKKEDYTSKTAHYYFDEVIQPTCKEVGYTLHTCVTCNYTYKDDYKDGYANHCGLFQCSDCNKDLYELVEDKIKQSGELDADGGYYVYTIRDTSSDGTSFLYSYVANDTYISCILISGNYSFGIYIPETRSNQTYTWVGMFGSTYTMSGTVNALFWQDDDVLTYTKTNYPADVRESARKLYSSFLDLLLTVSNIILSDIQMDVSNLGFLIF